MVGTTTTKRETMMNEFLNGQTGRVYAKGRLYTRQNGDAVQLVAYGHEILAEIEGNHVHLYTGHHGTVSQTVTRYVKMLGSVLSNSDGYEVTVHEAESPNTGIGTRVSEAAKYISNYVGDFSGNFSAVESQAKATVERYLQLRLEEEFSGE